MTRREILDKARAAQHAKMRKTFWLRFWNRVRKTDGDGCWEWLGSLNMCGYGQVKREGKAFMCHRLTFELETPIPHGLLVLHRCDNPRCVRPDHLFLGTMADNVADCISKGRRRYRHGDTPKRKGELNGRAKLTEESVKIIRSMDFSVFGSRVKAARRFGVSTTVISAVANRVNWKHVV